MRINILRMSRTLNSGYIFFDDPKTANEWKKYITPLFIKHSNVICIEKGKTYYGIKMFYTRKHVLELSRKLKEVLG